MAKHLSKSIRQAAINKTGGVCGYCGTELLPGWQVEHMIPLSRGGKNEPKNVISSCPTCNRDKYDRTVEEYREYLGGSSVSFYLDNLKG